jgi:2-methylcitrate dehydratase PrpD
MDAAYSFAENFVKTRYEDLPKDVVEATKKLTLDFLGVALGGSSESGIQELLQLFGEWGGKEESAVICSDQKLPATHAAQLNSTMGHSLDYDDTHDVAVMHSTVIAVPTSLALAERAGKLSGRDFITAVTLGIDMICRIGLASKVDTRSIMRGWHLTSLYGYVTAAAVAGKILGLDEEGIVNAIGIAYHQNAGNGQAVVDAGLTKRMGPGFATRSGLVAAFMAEKGITGAKNSFEGSYGLFNLYHNGTYDAKALTTDLGKHFEGINVSIKPYPCCRAVHSFIDCSLAMVKEHDMKPQDVAEITATCAEGAYKIVGSPPEIKRKPRTAVDAQFSIPWGVATALAKRRATMEDFKESAIHNEEVLGLSSKVQLEVDSSLGSTTMAAPATIKITTKGGQTYSGRIEYPLGSPQWPLTFDQCAEKFKDNASYAIRKLPAAKTDGIIDAVRQLEKVEDIREIIEMLR